MGDSSMAGERLTGWSKPLKKFSMGGCCEKALTPAQLLRSSWPLQESPFASLLLCGQRGGKKEIDKKNYQNVTQKDKVTEKESEAPEPPFCLHTPLRHADIRVVYTFQSKVSCQGSMSLSRLLAGEIKASTSTVAALFSKMTLTSQRITMVDMGFTSFYSISISNVGVDGARVCL